jgi:putative ABC transport system permease protein
MATAGLERTTTDEAPAGGSRGDGWWIGLAHDVRYAVRALRHAPGFAAVSVVTLAIGIGANTSIYSVLRAVILRPLPYADPKRLVTVGDAEEGHTGTVGYTTVVDWRAQTRSFDDLALVRTWTPTLLRGAEPERLSGVRVTANYFAMLGIRPALGRDLAAEEDQPARWRVVLISDGLWRRRFNADPSVVGRTIRMADNDYQVLGVLPASFDPLVEEHYYQRPDVWAPLGYVVGGDSACRSCQHLRAIGRLKHGITLESAERDINQIQNGLRAQFPSEYRTVGHIAVIPLTAELDGGIRPALTALMGAVFFVLLIACANVANLLLARMVKRERDLSLRAALGASRSRLVRELLVESLVVALMGALLSIALSAFAVPLIIRLTPFTVPRLGSARVDVGMMAFAVGLATATTLCVGLLPALRATRINVSPTLAWAGRSTSPAPTSAARRVLVGADVALAVVLLVGAGLMIRSVWRLMAVNPGFDPENVLTLQIAMSGPQYADDAQVVVAGDRILAGIRTLRGVTAVALAGQIPLSGNFDTRGFHVEGRPETSDDLAVERYSVTPEYFSAMRVPLVRGRWLTEMDRAGMQRVMVVAERTARLVWPGQEPVGQRVRFGSAASPPYTVVGVVGDVRHYEMAKPPTPQFYVSQRQFTDSFLTVVVRTDGDPRALAGDVRRAISAAATDVPVFNVETMSDLVAKSVGSRRFVMVLLELFGAIALLMTAIGIYGVISYGVSERTREIGVRTALGATRGDIARLIIGGGLVTVMIGLAVGCGLALGLTRYVQASLFGVSPVDPLTFAGVIAALMGVSLLAQALPVVRATRVEPVAALHQD